MFVPLIASAKPADEATEEALKDAVKSEEKEVKQGGAKTRPEVQIPMASIVGMRKSNKTAMGCVVSTGLQIDVDDGSVSGQCSVRPEKKESDSLTSVPECRLLFRRQPGHCIQSSAGFIERNFPTGLILGTRNHNAGDQECII